MTAGLTARILRGRDLELSACYWCTTHASSVQAATSM